MVSWIHLGMVLGSFVEAIMEKKKLSFEEAMTLFMESELGKKFQNTDTGVWKWGTKDILTVLDLELSGKDINTLVYFGGDLGVRQGA